MAQQQGVVDGQENPLANMPSIALNDAPSNRCADFWSQ